MTDQLRQQTYAAFLEYQQACAQASAIAQDLQTYGQQAQQQVRSLVTQHQTQITQAQTEIGKSAAKVKALHQQYDVSRFLAM